MVFIFIALAFLVGVCYGYFMGRSIKEDEWEKAERITFSMNHKPVAFIKKNMGENFEVDIYDSQKFIIKK